MKKILVLCLSAVFVMLAVPCAFSDLKQSASPLGNMMKSAGQAAGQSVQQAAVQAAIKKLSPQLQQLVGQSQKLGAPAKQENFLVTKAKDFLAAGNYQPASDLAGYVMTALNAKSLSAKKIMTDAQAALTKMAQDKLAQTQLKALAAKQQAQTAQAQADAAKTAERSKSLFGAFRGQK
jgi:hypothetical protein